MRLGILELSVLALGVFPAQAISQSLSSQPLSGAMLGNTCAGCHGTLGASKNEIIPPLAGTDPAQFASTMRAYRDGSLKGTIMNRVARAFSDAEIDAMAAYFSSLPKKAYE